MKPHSILSAAGGVLAFASSATAMQQFQYQAGVIPGPARWSEGLEAADVDKDGDLDLFVADGDGFSAPGTKRQNVLVINKLIELGSLSMVDESIARLGVHVSHAKGVTTADVNSDGWVDALFSNAFNTDPPHLYINQGFLGGGSAGFFTFEGAARGLTTVLAAGGAMFGDVDNDGDLDLITNANYLGSGSGAPRLYKNNGSGFFTEDVAFAAGAPAKSTHMDVQLVDIDNDFDVDFFGPNRATNSGGNHFLMLNNGVGAFSDSSSVLGATTANVYEADVGDLDGDLDTDLFFVSLSGTFAEGAMRNNLIPGGTLTFTNQAGLGGDDDNEIAFLDYDMDGDLDPFVGSLGAREKLWRNNGAFAFVNDSAAITAVADSTLDCTIADLDNDGRYDFITAQGESNSAQWINKLYRNVSGPVDTLAPVITAVNAPASSITGLPTVVRMKVRDQVMDDGVDYVDSVGRYVILTAPSAQAISINAGSFSPGSVSIPAGTTVTWTNNSGSNQDVTSTTSPYTYASGTIAPGGTYVRAFAAPGTYNYQSTLGGFSGTITVTGSASSVVGLRAGIGLRRFSFPDTAGGNGIELVYEAEFEDYNGNRTVSNSGKIQLVPNTCPNPSVYCTPKVTSSGCVPSMSSSGVPSLGAPGSFTATASALEPGQNGIMFFGTTGPSSSPFQDGTLCVNPSLYRLNIKNSGGAASCTGSFSYSLAEMLAQPQGGPLLVVNQVVNVQAWFRDPPAASTTGLSNGLQFTVCP